MMRKIYIVLLFGSTVALLSVFICALVYLLPPGGKFERETDFELTRRFVLQNDNDLSIIAKHYRQTQDEHPLCKKIDCYPHTIDDNGNVYFIVDWNTFSTTGFVYRNGQSEILGDGSEPTLAQLDRFKGQWWFYIAN